MLTTQQQITPWQRIGSDISDTASIDAAIEKAGLNWTVSRQPLYFTNSAGEAQQVRAYAITRDDTGAVLAPAVGPQFTPVQNADAFRWFQPYIDAGEVKLQTAGQTWGGERIWIFAGIARDPEMITPDDCVQQFLLLSNCHSSRASLQVGFVPVHLGRGVGMGVYTQTGRLRMLRLRHTANVNATLTTARNMIDAIAGQFRVQCDRFRNLTKRTAEHGLIRQYLVKLFDLTDKMGGLSARGESIVGSVLRRIDDDNPTWWSAYIAVCDHFNHAHRTTPAARSASCLFGQGNRLMRDALELAEEMIE